MGDNNEVSVYFDSLPLNATLLVKDALTQGKLCPPAMTAERTIQKYPLQTL